jgi:hypothetical protein
VAVLVLTSFSVDPSALVGLWLLGSGLLSWRERHYRSAVVVSGVVVLVADSSQLLMWRFVPVPFEASSEAVQEGEPEGDRGVGSSGPQPTGSPRGPA